MDDMDFREMLQDKKVREITGRFADLDGQVRDQVSLSFNLFEIVSGTHLHECCHSRIIAALLNKREEGRVFTRLFIEYLNTISSRRIDPADFEECRIPTEEGKIDICLFGKGKAIIVENKINHAPDQHIQIPSYIARVRDEGCEPVMVVYLTRAGVKHPVRDGWNKQQEDAVYDLLVPVSAYNSTSSDLVTGWLKECQEHAKSADARVLLDHYSQLLYHQGRMHVTRPIVNEFLEFGYDTQTYSTAQAIKGMFERLPIAIGYRIDGECKGMKSPFRPLEPEYCAAQWGCCIAWDQWKYPSESGESHLALRVKVVDHPKPSFIVQFVDQNEGPGVAEVLGKSALLAAAFPAGCPEHGEYGVQSEPFVFSREGECDLVKFIHQIMEQFSAVKIAVEVP